MARGLDVGTCFLVCASQESSKAGTSVKIKSIRDAFLDIEADQATINMLKMSNVSYVPGDEDQVFIVGEPAMSMANLFKREARRPLSKGVISAGDSEAERMLVILLKSILGEPEVEDETVYYSIPAAPLNSTKDILYHEAMFKKIIESLGYKATSMNEAAAIVYSNGSKEMFTALATSCLTPGQKILTKSGFKNIELIDPLDKVLTKEGLWESATPTSREYSGKVYTISAYGNGSIEVTEDHEIWALRGRKWSYIKAKDILEGDVVKQPWINFDLSAKGDPYLFFNERVTSSNEVKKVAFNLSSNMSELIGFFLGDGNVEKKNGAICWTIDAKDLKNIERVSSLVLDIFGKEVSIYPHTGSSVRIKMYHKGFMDWLISNCYCGKVKIVPFDISELNDLKLRHMLKGLIETDGNYNAKNSHIGFDNTSPNLAQFVYLGLHRLGLRPSYSCNKPRTGGTVGCDRVIEGKKECYQIKVNGYSAVEFISWLTNPVMIANKSFTQGSTVAKVSGISSREYSGTVYDVSVQSDDHSFCAPGIAVHNCGAGMVNTSLVYQTMVGMSFSLETSGDWIDQSVATALGTTATKIMSIKEKGVNLLDPTEGDPRNLREREAIVVYYKNLIHRVIDTIKKEFRKGDSGIELPSGIPWIIGGGTAKAINFLEFFKQEFSKIKDFPIDISEIRMAEDPLNDVSKGLLIAAMNA